jgi:chromosome segregation ATPase
MSKNTSDNSETVEDTKPISSEFKDLVVTWVEIDDNIRKLNAQLKEYKDEKKQYEQAVLEYLEKIEKML